MLNVAIPVCYLTWTATQRWPRRAVVAGRACVATALGREDTARQQAMLDEMLQAFDQIIVPSAKTARTLPAHRLRRPVAVVASAAAPLRPLSPAHQRQLDRLRTQVPLDRDTTIAFVGRLSPEKNLPALLRAIAEQVVAACPRAHLLVVGRGPHRRQYEQLAASLGLAGRVTFTGGLDRDLVPHVLGRCAVLAQPSLTETQGLVVSEAALVGTPSVLLDRELDGLVRHGENGYVAASEPEFGALLADLVRRPELRRRLGARAAQDAARYPPQAYATRVEAVYERARQPAEPVPATL